MRRFEKVLSRSDDASLPNLTLPYDLRRKTRQLVRLDDGEEIGLLLAPGTVLKDGDILESTEGDRVRIAAAAEPILFVTASDSEKLARAAYHLGNRHISASRSRSGIDGDVKADRRQCGGKERSLQSGERRLRGRTSPRTR